MKKFQFAFLVAGLLSRVALADDAAPALKPTAEHVSSTALRFRQVTSAGGMAEAQSTRVSIVRHGKTVMSPALGGGGTAQVGEIAPGVYSVFANGPKGWAAYGAYLGDGNHVVTDVGLVPQSDMPTVWNLFREARQNAQSGAPSLAGIELPAAKEHLIQDGVLEIQADGSVRGVIATAAPVALAQRSLPGMSLYLIRHGQVVAHDVTEENGQFDLTGLQEGIYSLVMAGPHGFGGMSVQVVRADEPAPTPAAAAADLPRFVFVAALSSPKATITPCPWSDFSSNEPIMNEVVNEEGTPAGAFAPGGGFGSGAGGGGAGAAGGGGLLGILAGAGAGIAAAAIFDNNNNNNPATPAVP